MKCERATAPKIEKAIQEVSEEWMNIDGLVGIGQGKLDGKDIILVGVSSSIFQINKELPKEYKGYPVKVVEWGEIFASENTE